MGIVRLLKIHNLTDSKHEPGPLIILSRRMLRVIKLTSVLIWSNAGPECLCLFCLFVLARLRRPFIVCYVIKFPEDTKTFYSLMFADA